MAGDDPDDPTSREDATDDVTGAAVAQFQRAALEAVAAARALLDAAESMIKEPTAVEAVVNTVNAFARQATEAVSGFAEAAARRAQTTTHGDGGADDDDGSYQGITVE